MSAEPVPPNDRRPLGVLILAGLQFVRAALVATQVLDLRLLPDDHLFQASFQVPRPPPGTPEFYLAEGIGIGLILASAAFGIGLLTGRRWGWVGAIVISGVSLAISIGAWWEHDPTYLAMVLNVVAVFYLNQRDVRAHFGELQADEGRTDA